MMSMLFYNTFVSTILSVTMAAIVKNEHLTADYVVNSFEQNKYIQYNKVVRPPSDGPVIVTFRPKVMRIVSLDVDDQVLTVQMRSLMIWTDTRLEQFYDAIGYSSDDSLLLSASKVWIPDIRLYYSADKHHEDHDVKPVVSYTNGRMSQETENILNSYCPISHEIQAGSRVNCTLQFGSWSYVGNNLNFKEFESDKIELATYAHSREWKMIDSHIAKEEIKYACCPEVFVAINLTLELERTNFVLH